MQNPSIPRNSRGVDPPRNRAYDTRRDNDTFTIPEITIYDIDYAIFYYLQERISPKVEENGRMIDVPIFFANGEKWAQIQKHGYLRDKSRQIMTPVMSIRRTGIVDDDRVPKLDVPNNPDRNAILLFPDKQHNNKYDRIHSTYNTKESHTYYVSALPEFILVSYELHIWTNLMEQMNGIIQEIIPQNRFPWGDAFQFTTKIQDYSFDTINDVGSNRIVKCTMPLEVSGILQNSYEMRESTVRKAFTTKRVVFKNERSQDNFIVDYEPKIIRPAESRLPKKSF